MELEIFKDVNKSELSMIEVAHAILKQRGDVIPFADLVNEVQEYLSKSDEEIRERLSQFYTDLNVDGSFISLGDNLWGLRSWYPYDSIDEAVIHIEDDDTNEPKSKKRKKVNAFMSDATEDDDVIDYNNDDPEDGDLDADYDDSSDDKELKEYSKDLSDIDDPEDDEELPDGIEGQLTELSDDDDLNDDDNE
ncbi:DNA-directed RNA polymerase subunit delta [Liquorilactobacillus oeni]|uniref:Probable DNA-directed RNA polymerase subunit delta n=1 Tax=Liquorilactobacillus oeni DSM 19972 TaxID=1423777 RepID=A0A0R1MDG8_9LACO|nr:DNA-directed RNA polymerase subunit delta [Liquorilactobacillus oeni]KRL06215.1 DNA-directed RNA polymerase subunit delta [Liquorilactobacillus oeni DSM 19972]